MKEYVLEQFMDVGGRRSAGPPYRPVRQRYLDSLRTKGAGEGAPKTPKEREERNMEIRTLLDGLTDAE
jgi:hypothetical protein